MTRARIAPFLRPQRRLIVAAALAMIGATAISLAAPVLAKEAIDHGVRRHDRHVVDLVALAYLVLVVVRPVLERVIVLCSARAGERFLGDLRVAAYAQLHALSVRAACRARPLLAQPGQLPDELARWLGGTSSSGLI